MIIMSPLYPDTYNYAYTLVTLDHSCMWETRLARMPGLRTVYSGIGGIETTLPGM